MSGFGVCHRHTDIGGGIQLVQMWTIAVGSNLYRHLGRQVIQVDV
jgi:hypothetical protein